jgi:hypothetical protein
MPTKLRSGRWAALIVLVALLAGGSWWSVARVSKGANPHAAGRSAYDRGDWDRAVGLAREVLKDSPTDARAIRLLARASARSGRDEAALALFRRLESSAPEAEDHFLLARIFTRRGQADLARDQLWRAYRQDPAHAEALNDLIRSLAQNDALTKAVELATELRGRPGWQARGAVALGLLRAAQDDPTAAAEALEAALAIEPNLEGPPASATVVRKLLARHRLALGQPDLARAALGALDDPEVRWLRARADLQEGWPTEEPPNPSSDPMAHEPAPYVGSARCAACHASNARRQRESHHARTFWAGADLAGLPLPDRPMPDPVNAAVVHRLHREQGEIQVETQAEGRTYQALLVYAFGSGDRGLTPVGRVEAGNWCELRMSRYAGGSLWDVTTGHEARPSTASDWLGKAVSADELRQCVGCHTTAPRAARTDAGALRGDRGIGCERCHGPGGHHVEAVAAGLNDPAIARPRLARGEAIVRLCGQCHSPKGRTVSPNDPTSIRFQATTLTWSRCFTQSQDRLDCVTCHDPHQDVETSPVSYESKCLSCHGAAAGPRCPVNPTRGCIGCHMPTNRGAIPHSPFTDHHIRVHPAGPALRTHALTKRPASHRGDGSPLDPR